MNSEVEDKEVEIIPAEQKKEFLNEDSLRDLYNNTKHITICIREIQEGE